MEIVQSEVINVANSLGIQIETIEKSVCDLLFDEVLKKYTDFNIKSNFIWDKLLNASYIEDSCGWMRIGEFIKNNHCLLLIDNKKMFGVQNGYDLTKLLSNCFSFEFYVLDRRLSYLICFNHHDVLCGCGLAKKWIDEMKPIQ